MSKIKKEPTAARTEGVTHAQQQDVSEVRQRLTHAAQQAAAVRHPAEQHALAAEHRLLDDLQKQHDAGSLDRSVDREFDRSAITAFKQSQREQLEQRQKLELTAATKLVDSADHRMAAMGLEAVRDHVAQVNQQMRRDLQAIAAVLESALEGPERRAALDGVLRKQTDAMAQLHEEAVQRIGLTEERQVDLQASQAHLEALNEEQVEAVNARISEHIGVTLEQSAIQRVAAEAQSRRQFNDLDQATRHKMDRASVSRVKGQLFEELLERHITSSLSRLNASRRPDEQLQFIRGDRIRDDKNRKLTDGVLAWRNRASGDWHIFAAFEAKSGHDAARELNQTLEKLTLDGKAETRRYARDIARDELLGRQRENETVDQYAARQAEQLENLTEEERERLEQRTEQLYEELLTRRVQTELGGQVEKTIERLHETTDAATRILIDGEPARLAIDRGRTDVIGVVPQDVLEKNVDLRHLDYHTKDLQLAAEAFVEELRRRGNDARED